MKLVQTSESNYSLNDQAPSTNLKTETSSELSKKHNNLQGTCPSWSTS